MTARTPHHDLAAVLDRIRIALAICSEGLRLEWGNEAFFREFPESRLGALLEEGPEPWGRPQVKRLLRQTARSAVEFDQLEVVAPERAGRSTSWLLTALALPPGSGEGRILLAIENAEDRVPGTGAREPVPVLQDMAAEVAHEFSHLLVDVLGNAATAEDQLDAESKARRSVQRVQSAARRGIELANRLLLFSGQTSRPMEPLDLRRLIEQEADRKRRSLPAHIALETERPSDPVRGLGDESLLRQVVQGVIDNAVEGLGDRAGSIRVAAAPVRIDAGWLARAQVNEGLPTGEYASIEIEDDGPGMDEPTLARACEPFFSTRFGGCGLGLAAASGGVRAMGGALAISSGPGKGTRVRIVLPCGVSDEAPRPTIPTLPLGKDASVLVIEHDPDVLDLARSALEGLGLQVVAAPDPDEGAAIFRARPERYRSVLLDWTARDRSAERTLRELRRIRPEVAIVRTGRRGSPRGHALAAESPHVLEKPYTPGQLIDRLAEAVAWARAGREGAR